MVVTGGCGFIGSAVVRRLVEHTAHSVVNVDSMTYASSVASVASVQDSDRYVFERGDVCDRAFVQTVFETHRPDAVMHLAAESHVDRSIDLPEAFGRTNVLGTMQLLEAARKAGVTRFHHVGTDEVFGSLDRGSSAFSEDSPYDPRSPYAATKASADHLVRAWGHTYGLPIVISSCSNNYGPFQFPEKLVPLAIIRAIRGEPIPVYGAGENIRDWLHVEDHAAALVAVLESGRDGQTYNIGASCERTTLHVVHSICDLVDEMRGSETSIAGTRELVTHVADRPGHDVRYAIDPTKIRAELRLRPDYSFEDGLAQTVRWYVDNAPWWQPLVAQGATKRQGNQR